jgi:hypothetical protein
MHMPKPDEKKIEEELRRQEKGVYGDKTISGSGSDTEDVTEEDTEEHMADVYGEDVSEEIEENEPVTSGEEIKKDEHKRHGHVHEE